MNKKIEALEILKNITKTQKILMDVIKEEKQIDIIEEEPMQQPEPKAMTQEELLKKLKNKNV